MIFPNFDNFKKTVRFNKNLYEFGIEEEKKQLIH